MELPANLVGALLLILFGFGLPVLAAESPKPPGPPTKPPSTTQKVLKGDWKPVPESAKPTASHAPFETGDCQLCHERSDPANPGKVLKSGNALCFDCHEEFPQIMARKFGHVAASESCLSCHNPHNSVEPKLLLNKASTLCFECHKSIQELAEKSPVRHGALTEGAQCMSCHNAHSANVEHLLIQMPRELCLSCHNKDGLKDAKGKPLLNTQHEFEEMPQLHGALGFGDCSACHNPHGFQHFRLLNKEYPADFYASYDPKTYALCFECHEAGAFTEAETDTLTQFRDGLRNLHRLHVNKEELGRTCRACHEVHSSKLPHLIRESVPYGSLGWRLKINFKDTPTGGSCAKTCHGARVYNNSGTTPANPPPAATATASATTSAASAAASAPAAKPAVTNAPVAPAAPAATPTPGPTPTPSAPAPRKE